MKFNFTLLKNSVPAILITLLLFVSTSQAQMRQVFVSTNNNDISRISFFSPSKGYVAFKNWIGYTADSGRTFTQRHITTANVNYGTYLPNILFAFAINGVSAISQDTFAVYGDYGFEPSILYTSNGGSSYTLVYHTALVITPPSGAFSDMLFHQNGSIGYAINQNKILKSLNKGLSWSVILNDPTTAFRFLDGIDNNNLFAYGSNKLFRSTNGGSTWQQITVPAGEINYVDFINLTTGWIQVYSASQSHFYYTNNGGTTWVQRDNVSVPFGRAGRMQFINDSTGYAKEGNFTVYKTTDSGKIWEPLPRDNNYALAGPTTIDLHCMGATQLWSGGKNGFLELSTNAGGNPLPKAYFKVDTTNAYITNIVNLKNFSKTNYQYKWFVNGSLVSTNYHASYTHDVYHPDDTIKLVVINGALSDTLIKIQNVGAIPKPKILSFSPTSATAGATVTISGNFLLTASAVRFGNFPAASFTVISGNTVTAVVGNGESGRVHITTTGGMDSIAGFTFIPPPPTISSITPSTATPGTPISIYGTFFNGATAVSFGAAPAASFTVVSQTEIQAVLGAGASGNVLVTTPTGTGTFNGITVLPLVSINSFSPASGPVGTSVTITGNNFSSTAANNVVYFGGTRATVNSASATSLVVTAPAGATYLPITVAVNNQIASAMQPFIITYAGGGVITTGSFNRVGTYATFPFLYPSHSSMGDIDNDGKLDIVTGGKISVFRNNTTGNNISFASRMDIIPNQNINGNVLRDVNGDGLPDLVVGASGNRIAILKNKSTVGNISFDTMHWLASSVPTASSRIAIQDIDGDGRPDIAAITGNHTSNANNSVAVFRNKGQNNNLAFDSALVYTGNGTNDFDVILTDLDGDRKPEMLFTSTTSHLLIFRNISTPGKIVFAAPVNPFPNGLWSMAAGDFDGDNKTDLAVFGRNQPLSTFTSIEVYKNTSTGPGIFSFAPSFTCLVNDPYSIQAADMDGDGKVDMISANQAEQTVSLYKNTSTAGSISFAPKVNFTTVPDAFPRSSPVGDLDNDGKPDFAFVNQIPCSFDIFRNRIGESVANAGPDATICAGNNFQIGSAAISGYTYSWSSNPAGFTSSVANPSVSPLVNTSYYLTVTDGVIIAKDTIVITVNPSPTVNAGSNVSICSGSSTQLNASGGAVYSWSPTIGLSNSNIANPVASPLSTTVYTVTVSNTSNCSASASVTVTVNALVSPSVTINTTNNPACLGSPATFTAIPANGGSNPVYQWQVNGINAGSNSNTFSTNALNNNDRVKVTITSNASCLTGTIATSNDVVMIVQQLATPLISLTNMVYAVTNADISATYTWQKLTNNIWTNVVPLSQGTTYTATVAGEYRVMAVKGSCLSYSQSLVVAGRINVPINPYGINIYPNPANEHITIDSIDLSQNWLTLAVLTVDGKFVSPVINIANQSTVTINIAMLQSGVYYIFMRRKDAETTSLAFIKQ